MRRSMLEMRLLMLSTSLGLCAVIPSAARADEKVCHVVHGKPNREVRVDYDATSREVRSVTLTGFGEGDGPVEGRKNLTGSKESGYVVVFDETEPHRVLLQLRWAGAEGIVNIDLPLITWSDSSAVCEDK